MSIAMLVALGIEAVLGWPGALYRRCGHPVTWLGALIAALDRRWNCGGRRRLKGAAAAALVIGLAGAAGALVQAVLPAGVWGVVLAGVVAWPLVAARSLHDHVAAVARPLAAGDLGGARGAVAGLPGIAAYKAINTLDSMIGHRTARHGDFGWAAARIDDVANLIPARLTALLVALAGGRFRTAWRVVQRDARHHRSPNGGWPEAAMAGALGVRLSGPRIYADRVAAEPWLNAGAGDPGAAELWRGLAVYRRAVALAAVVLAVVAVV